MMLFHLVCINLCPSSTGYFGDDETTAATPQADILMRKLVRCPWPLRQDRKEAVNTNKKSRILLPDRLIKEALQSFGRIMHDSGGTCFGKERRKANFPSSCYGAEKTMHTA
ncbi:hypothetical protein D5086_016992 [Populus alba]|uniref:Uncharacterized protein n=1 Tax=Populus alba TaxID=43335 RepID=A0ACC4BW76_POPAL